MLASPAEQRIAVHHGSRGVIHEERARPPRTNGQVVLASPTMLEPLVEAPQPAQQRALDAQISGGEPPRHHGVAHMWPQKQLPHRSGPGLYCTRSGSDRMRSYNGARFLSPFWSITTTSSGLACCRQRPSSTSPSVSVRPNVGTTTETRMLLTHTGERRDQLGHP